MLFPQLEIYKKKQRLVYQDIVDILFIVANLKQTWNYESFKKNTHLTWMEFKDKLDVNKKLVFRSFIIQTRKVFLDELNSQNKKWLDASIVTSIVELTSIFVLKPQERKKMLNLCLETESTTASSSIE